MILFGIIWSVVTGTTDKVMNGLLSSAEDAISLSLTMLGVMAFWCGILEIGEQSGTVDWLAKKMNPLINFLFPNLDKDHKARKNIAVNMVANVLGLGSAATPAGLEAMKELQNTAKEKHIATDEMCVFLIINISSLQLIPMTIIAFRAEYGAAVPSAIVGPALIATMISTIIAIIFCKVVSR